MIEVQIYRRAQKFGASMSGYSRTVKAGDRACGWRKALLISISTLALMSCSGGEGGNAKLAARDEANCTAETWHELHSDVVFNHVGFGDREKAIEYCSSLTRSNAASPVGFEHLGVIYALPMSEDSAAPSDMALAIENFRKAEERGSAYAAYALAKAALSGEAGTEHLRASAVDRKRTALAALESRAKGGSLAAKMLYVDLAMRGPGLFADTATLRDAGVVDMFQEIAGQKADFLYEYHLALAKEGVCRSISSPTAEKALGHGPPAANFATCHLILETAAQAGSTGAALDLGLTHIEIARAIAKSQQPNWRDDVRRELGAAKTYLLISRDKGTGLTAGISQKLLTDIDNLDMSASSSSGAGFAVALAALVVLAAAGGGDQGGASSYESEGPARSPTCPSALTEAAMEGGTGPAHMAAAWGGCYD
jgi:hypothetical protein